MWDQLHVKPMALGWGHTGVTIGCSHTIGHRVKGDSVPLFQYQRSPLLGAWAS